MAGESTFGRWHSHIRSWISWPSAGRSIVYWALLLHWYQPPTQLHRVLKSVCEESYRPLLKLFRDFSHARATVNINAVLTETLSDHGMSDVIDALRDLGARGQIEFTGSAKHHAILPLIDRGEMLRQIKLNEETNRFFFGESYRPRGFFPPELCYSRELIGPVAESGHEWLLLSGIACPVGWPVDVIYEVSLGDRALAVFFRDDLLSNRVSFRETDARGFIEHLSRMAPGGKSVYVVTAMDAETFGHHVKDWVHGFLAEVYRAVPGKVEPVTLSQLLDLFPRGHRIEPRPSSWSTSPDDLERGNPYPLWKSPDNVIHQLLWQHLRIVVELVGKAVEIAASDEAKHHAQLARETLDRALHSDQFWWASRRPMWEPNIVNRGLMEQREAILNAYKAIQLSERSEDAKREYYYRYIAARDLREKITDQLFMF